MFIVNEVPDLAKVERWDGPKIIPNPPHPICENDKIVVVPCTATLDIEAFMKEAYERIMAGRRGDR